MKFYRQGKEEKEAAAVEAVEVVEEEEECKVNIEVGMKFQMGSLFYSVESLNGKAVKCTQLADTKDDAFPSEVVLQNKQLEHVIILTDEEYETKKNKYNAKKEEVKEEPEPVKEEIKVEIGAKFQMGTVYYSVISVDVYVKCDQIGELKDDAFPDTVYLEKNQLGFVKIINDDEYKTAVNEYKPKQASEEEEAKEQIKEDPLANGLNTFSAKYIFDDENETVIIKHNQGKTLRINPDDNSKICEKGGSGQFARWIVEFDGGDKYQRITLKNTKTNKYLKISNEGKDIDVSGEQDDDGNFFKAITNDKDDKNTIKLESCQFKGKFVSITAENGVAIADDDDKTTKFAFYKELTIKVGIKFKMGDISYEIEAIADYVKCKQISDSKEFPLCIYLEKNQLNHVTIIKDGLDIPDKKKPKSRPTSARDKIAMFEKKEEEPKPKSSPKPKKLKAGKLNAAKFAGLNINPGALKPGQSGKTKIMSGGKEGGEIDQKPKVEQATITKGKRKKRKKKALVLEDTTDVKEEKKIAPQLFYDEKAAAKSKKEREKQYKAAEKAKKKGGGGGSSTKGGGESTETKGKPGAGGGGDQPAAAQANGGGGGCCVIL